MAKEADTTFQGVFSQASSTYSNKLLPWCVSSAVPLQYMSKVLATTVQEEEDVPVVITVPDPESSQTPNLSDSLACSTGAPPLPVSPFLYILFVGTLLLGYPFTEFIAGPTLKKQDHSPSGTLRDEHNKQTCVDSQEVKVRSNHSSTQGDEDTPKLVPEARPCSKPQGQEPASPPSSPTKATTHPDYGTVVGTSRSTGDQNSESDANHSGASSDSDTSRGNMANSNMKSASGNCITHSDTDEVTIRTIHK